MRYLDMDPTTFAPTLAMVQEAVERPRQAPTAPLAGVLWVHIGGIISPEFPADVEYCRGQGLFILEDAAHIHGSQLCGAKAGNLADAGAFSFFPTKVMTTCEARGRSGTWDSGRESSAAMKSCCIGSAL